MIRQFYMKYGFLRFSENRWLDIVGHSLVGGLIAVISVNFTGNSLLPVLILFSITAALLGFTKQILRRK